MDQKNVHLITTVICGISSGEFFLVTTVVNGDFEKKFEINGKKIKFIQDQHKGPDYNEYIKNDEKVAQAKQ